MKNLVFRYLFLLLAITDVIGTGCSSLPASAKQVKSLELAAAMDELVVYEMGTIILGSSAELLLTLKNSLQSPVIVNEARVFCACTIPEFNSEPILPGKTAKLKIIFMADHAGIFSKSVKIYLNFRENPVEVKLTGKVL